MKKILYFMDVEITDKSSVSEIALNIIDQPTMHDAETVVVTFNGGFATQIKKKEKNIVTYIQKRTIISRIIHRFLFFLDLMLVNGYDNKYSIRGNHYRKKFREIIEFEKPDLVIFIYHAPYVSYTKILNEYKIDFIQILYDTFVSRPELNLKYDLDREKQVISNSKGYYVPFFFYDDYKKHYPSYCEDIIHPYNLPLLISKENVIESYRENKIIYEFSYFGQLQIFRNLDAIHKVCSELDIKIDIFTQYRPIRYKEFIYHKAILKDELWKAVASSRFLVIFDNSKPFNNYLPSKAVLYVSFCKPIIVFGDNESSAVIDFLKDYPMCYYQKLNGNLDGLKQFIKKYKEKDIEFSESIYNQYRRYLPDEALKPIGYLLKELWNR